MHDVTIHELKEVVALRGLPDEHLQWILERSVYQELEDGAVLLKVKDPVDVMWILLEGNVSFYMDINGRLVYYFTFSNDEDTGGVGGLLPYSRMKTSPGYSYAVGKVRLLRLHKKYFPELELLNPDFIQRLIGYMTERARSFATTKLQHEKVNSLGNLAAGIAHELNNPVAAINRISSELTKRLKRNFDLTEELLRTNVRYAVIQSIRMAVEQKDTKSSEYSKLTAMERLKNEDELIDWLENHKIESKEAAETLSEYGFSISDFEKLQRDVGNDAFPVVLPWLENLISSSKIIKDLEEASSRISNLVGAIKSHVHMDRTNELQPTNIHQDIENTLILLGFKLRDKNIVVTKKFCDNLPDVPAYVGELNQVWTNIIDNAIFAVPQNGKLSIVTSCDERCVKVCIVDNGSGIPKEILSRIFDPFFTTKKVGEGTGIGLDLVNRIIKRHNGNIKVNSVSGRTEFSISLPLKTKTEA